MCSIFLFSFFGKSFSASNTQMVSQNVGDSQVVPDPCSQRTYLFFPCLQD